MKNTVLLFVLLFCFSCGLPAQKVIGEIVNGQAVLTIKEQVAKDNWEKLLKVHQNISVQFKTLKIIQQDELYLLLGTSSTVNAIIVLREENGQIYEARAGGGSRTVTCTGCTSGCTPTKDSGIGWICKFPCKECKKTETVTEDLILE
ncbi:MAG: hypothetical protein AB8G15_12060 [Saprospiraceae bacterium]